MKCLAGLLKGGQDIDSTAIAIFRLRCHATPDNGFKGGRKRARNNDPFHWETPGKHLIQDDAERVDVVARSGNTIEAFRGHIGEGADLLPRRRQWRAGRLTLFRGNPKVNEPHIHLPGRFLVVEQDIARFEIAVNNAPAMDVRYRLH